MLRLAYCPIFLFSFLFLSACEQAPIKVGFAGSLTGKFSDLGVPGRNGLQLAIEEINQAGGIAGRPLELLVRDDAHNAIRAISADKDLLNQGVVAIVGHMTSAMTSSVLPEIEAAGGILIAPTTTSSSFTGQQDALFRVVSDNHLGASALAEYSHRELKAKRIYILGDSSNQQYSDSYIKSFVYQFSALGGEIETVNMFSSATLNNWQSTADAIQQSNPDLVLMVASAKDLAGFAELIEQQQLDIQLISSAWAFSSTILDLAGNAVNGIYFSTFYSADRLDAAYVDFKQRYYDRFGFEASFAASFAYESMLLLQHGLIQTKGEREGLEQHLAPASLSGIYEQIHVDEYGDVQRAKFISIIEQGQFRTLATVAP